ncbi:hypothetical protein GCM10010116_60970 [Microbispora rosea subsp. aerata]|nr:hypothetical protein [Microbispora rosea]GGO30450.1 hypothetical protein GCM10010116_60970 [Microbispora rosea subsp. aerata]GIH59110.1 hypothetical protein Mro02_60240 [Microbispora rosea subsp. aerata]GLJ86871.1 hypothetical protein GCM10017588_56130 [Microbispora rosea subsp. aerata]
MDPDTFRGDVGVEGADVYWRRRVSVLTGMLVVVAVVAWACSSASGRSDETAAAKATPSDRLVVSLPAGLAPKTPDAASAAPGQPSPSASASASPSPGKPRRPGDPCDEKDLVLALQTGQDVYAKGVTPTFLLTVVSTGKVECTVDVGPRTLEMRVTSGGQRLWSTADCVAGDGVDKQLLERGVPYVRTIRWDRHRSGTTCAGKRSPADPGTYVATAHAGRLKSPKVVFHLR